MMDEAYARQRTPTGPRPEYIPPKTYRRDAVIPGNPDLRKALENGPMTRDELARHFQCSRSDVAKPIYRLIRSGEVIEEGDRISLLRRDLPSEAPECYPSTTQPQKIDSRAVSVPTMGVVDVGFRDKVDALRKLEAAAGSHDQDLQQRWGAIHAKIDPHLPSPGEDPHPAIVALHDAATHLADLVVENRALAERIKTLELRLSTVSEALDAAERIQEKMQKLREVLG